MMEQISNVSDVELVISHV